MKEKIIGLILALINEHDKIETTKIQVSLYETLGTLSLKASIPEWDAVEKINAMKVIKEYVNNPSSENAESLQTLIKRIEEKF